MGLDEVQETIEGLLGRAGYDFGVGSDELGVDIVRRGVCGTQWIGASALQATQQLDGIAGLLDFGVVRLGGENLVIGGSGGIEVAAVERFFGSEQARIGKFFFLFLWLLRSAGKLRSKL